MEKIIEKWSGINMKRIVYVCACVRMYLWVQVVDTSVLVYLCTRTYTSIHVHVIL
jgi:hypothetical protein